MKKLKLLTASLFIAAPMLTMAIPARPTPYKINQPDGSELTVYIRGDERHHFYTTEDGYLIRQNSTGYYCYALTDSIGEITLTSVKANDIVGRTVGELSLISGINRDTQLKSLNAARGLKISKDNATLKKAASDAGMKKTNYPNTTGTQKGLVILVEFKDKAFYVEDPNAAFDRMLNLQGYSENDAYGSAADYYKQTSNGAFTPDFDVYGPVTLSNNMSYYGGNDLFGNDRHPEEMVIEACQQLDDVINFAEYDLNEDGFIDNIFIFYAGYGEADGGPASSVWPHAWEVLGGTEKEFIFDGKILNGYACSNELSNGRGYEMVGIGTFCHEFGHVLGLPDMYCTDYTNCFTPGYWEIMDVGSYNGNGKVPPHMSSYSRYSLGWMQPTEITPNDTTFVLNSIISNQAYIIKTEEENEYFLLENRQQYGWDQYIPYHGMLIWHIDYDEKAWYENTVNNFAGHQRIDIEEADNKRTESSVKGDCFPGTSNITDFTDTTLPGMTSWNGQGQNKPLTDIREAGGVIYFNVIQDKTTSAYELNAGELIHLVAENNSLRIVNDRDEDIRAYIYGSTGSLIRTTDIAPYESSICVFKSGIYMVKCGDTVRKIIIR